MAGIGSGQSMVVGRGLVEILPDFRKWGSQLASDMKIASQQALGQIRPVEGSFRDAQGRLRDANGHFIKEYENGWKGAATTVVKSMAMVGKATTLVGIGVAVAATKMAGDFQAHTAVLQTAAGETSKGLKTVRAGILSISTNTGTGLQNLTDGMYTIEKAGFRGADGLKVLKAAAQGAREENAKLSDVTNAMTSVMASYHLKATDSTRVMNAMKTAAGEGKITMEEFSGALSTVLPIASANKISFEQVAGSVATLTQHGTSAREATHELASTIRSLASPNLVASREMARFGLSSVDVAKNLGKRGLSGTIDLLTTTILSQMGPAGTKLQKTFEGTKQSAQDAQIMLGKMKGGVKDIAEQYLKGQISIGDWNKFMKGTEVVNRPVLQNFKVLVDRSRGFSRELKNGGPAAQTYTDALKKMSGGAIGLNTILQLSGESAAGNADRIGKVGKSFHNSSKDVEGWKVTAGLLNVQMDKVKQTVQVLAINMGTKLIPVVSAAAGFFAKHQSILIGLVAVILSFIAATSAAYIGMKLWAVGSAVASAAMFLFNIATMAETDSLAVMRGQLALLWIQERLVALWTAITSSAFWGLAAAILANPLTWIVVAVVALVAGIVLLATKTQFFQTIWRDTWGFVKTVFLGFYHWFKDNWQLITFTIMTLGIGLAVAEIVRHWSAVKGAFVDAFDWVKGHWPLLLAIITGPIGLAVYYVVTHWKMISDGAKQVWHDVAGFFVSMGKDIGSFFSKLPGQIAGFFTDTLPGALSSMWKAVSDWFTKLPGRIWGLLKGLGSATQTANDAMLSMGQNLIKGLWSGATNFFTKSVPDFFKTLWHGLVDYFKAVFGIHSPSTVWAALGGDLMRGLFVGMLKIAVTVGAWLDSHLFKPLVGFFKNSINWLVSTGKNVVNGFIRGQLAVANTLVSWLTNHIYHPLNNFFRNAISWLVTEGRNVINGFIRGQLAVANGLRSWLQSHVYAPVNGFFKGAGTWLYNEGKNVLNGLLSGMKTVWKGLTSWVSGIAKWIKDHKGPISLDAKLLTPAGKALMKGLLHGLKIGFKDVGSFIYGTGDSVADVVGKLKGLFSSGLGSIGLGTDTATGGAQKYAQTLLKSMGLGGANWPALKALWNGESGWRWNALNKSSGAYGIPQSLPASKMASAGSDWRTNAATQIRWGLSYIRSRYGNPVNAYSAWLRRSPHWYDAGGIARGVGAMMKNTLQPERVLSPHQTQSFDRLVGVISGGSGGGSAVPAVVINDPHFHNHGVIGSKLELENWLVESLDTLRKKGRIK